MKQCYVGVMIAVIFLMSGLIGCANKYPVTFDSFPKGATLKCGNTNIGYTPQTLYLTPDQYEEVASHMHECSAIWSSGAIKQYGPFSTTKFPNGVKQTVERPLGQGYEQDAEFALKIENMKTQRRQAAAAERQATAAEEAVNQQQNYNSNSLNYKLNSPKACRKIGDLSGRIYYFDSGFCPVGYY